MIAPTSRQAYARLNRSLNSPMHTDVLAVINRFSHAGATHEDVRLALPKYLMTSLPRVYLELEAAGKVRFTERVRKSSFNRDQRIMVALRSAA